ncbi:TetR family transcriptional regulator [Rhodopseudomonas sp. HC1]|uniref:TetR/AcrR family transcriptional regulator n=1 Tax=Rhodopseudomonas infernalis TaxID=2897386 RepID=UPI001EE96D9C|nr:TetR family transcriptional regulator [Rhodopseudomonas infernalis]MCG6204525.1 TetR family transcriptional regulator [Rhodopseudomonas infernalis]
MYWNDVPNMSRCSMVRHAGGTRRRLQALSRERIIEASIDLLDGSGEDGLTFRALSERLSTGPGAIYGHIPNKSELLIAACDSIVARTVNVSLAGATPEATIRGLALGLFDMIDAHPWVGSALARAPGRLPMVRILESIGQQVRALGVPDEEQWATVGALLNYMLGVGGQNAANGQLARTLGLDRSDFLGSVSIAWSELDPADYPFTHSIAGQLLAHDDRADFLAGIDLILRGVDSSRRSRAARGGASRRSSNQRQAPPGAVFR